MNAVVKMCDMSLFYSTVINLFHSTRSLQNCSYLLSTIFQLCVSYASIKNYCICDTIFFYRQTSDLTRPNNCLLHSNNPTFLLTLWNLKEPVVIVNLSSQTSNVHSSPSLQMFFLPSLTQQPCDDVVTRIDRAVMCVSERGKTLAISS